MITHKFTAEDCGSEIILQVLLSCEDTLVVPLQLRIPRCYLLLQKHPEFLEDLQAQIATAVKEMVDKLHA
jgi:hypothetical protein